MPPAATTSQTPASESAALSKALFRWRLGHQTFHLYLVAMTTILDELTAAAAPSEERMAVLLTDLATLFEATAACMKYASNFERAAYENTIRPSMEPPTLKPGFSGSLNIDHKRMTHALALLPEILRVRFGETTCCWPAPVAEGWRVLVAAERETRHHHGFVCRRLVTGGSLLRLHMCGQK